MSQDTSNNLTLPARPSPYRWWVCFLLLLATTLNYMDRTALNQTSKQIIETFQLTKEQYGLLESAFTLAFGLGTLICGWLVDRISVRWVYPILVLGWSAAGFFTGYAQTVWFLFMCRTFLGLFEAGNWPSGMRTTRQVLPPAERSLGNSLFQSGTAIGAVLTPIVILICYRYVDGSELETWRFPFRVIGLLGLLWVALWIFTVPTSVINRPVDPGSPTTVSGSFWLVFRDRRYWILATIVMAINTSWHTARVWLPLYLQETWGYSLREVQFFTIGYYLMADVGSWTVGFLSLWLTWRGFSVHASRRIAFIACTGLVLSTMSIPFLSSNTAVIAVLLIFAFGALGLFPTYFALSQDVSAQHQGKVTGTLGAINAVYLAGLFWMEGALIERTKDYTVMLASAGIPALIASVLLATLWPKNLEPESSSP